MTDLRDVHPHYDVLAEVLRTETRRDGALKELSRQDQRYANWNADVDPMGPNRAVIAKGRKEAEKELIKCVSAFQAAVTAAVLKGASGTDIRKAMNGIVPVHWSAPGVGSGISDDPDFPGL